MIFPELANFFNHGMICSNRLRGRRLGRGRREEAGFLILVLELLELPVEAALRQKLLVRTHLAQLAFVHDENGFGALNGGEPVRN